MTHRSGDLARQAQRAVDDAVAAAKRETWAEAARALRAAVESGNVATALAMFEQYGDAGR